MELVGVGPSDTSTCWDVTGAAVSEYVLAKYVHDVKLAMILMLSMILLLT
jgi:hypothetical protein